MRLTSAIPVLRSGDYPRARKFWSQVLGFTIGEEAGDPTSFGIFKRDAAIVFVDAWYGADSEPHAGWRAYFHTDDVNALAERLRGKGVDVDGPRDTFYGMREITLRDPDGNLLCFGQDVA